MRFESTVLPLVVACALATGCAATRPPPSDSTAPAPRDTHERLNSVLWTQTSAEFWVLCTASFARAERSLDAALGDATWTALDQESDYEALPPAVIVDLDETVLDNSRMQGQLVLERTPYRPEIWRAWSALEDAAALPGALGFLRAVEDRGVETYFVTNRRAEEQSWTLDNLAKLGIAATDANVLCRGENGWTADKAARRAAVAERHRVVLVVGDDLNDFVPTTGLSLEERIDVARKNAGRWGISWFLIPNPLYGSWERAIHPGLSDDAAVLEKKRATVRGFR